MVLGVNKCWTAFDHRNRVRVWRQKYRSMGVWGSMKIDSDGCLLRILVGESRKYQGKPLYEWLVLKARELGLAGATVIRGIMGFGANSRIHTAKILRLSEDLPVVIEIVDSRQRIEDYLEVVEGNIEGGLATIEKADVRFYRSRHSETTLG